MINSENANHCKWQYYLIYNHCITVYSWGFRVRFFFLNHPFFVTPQRILSINKDPRKFGRIQFIAKSSSMYTKFCLRHKLLNLLQKLALSLLYNFHQKHILLKLKKLSPKINVKNKNSSLESLLATYTKY